MSVDRRIARRFVKADQEPMAESLHLAVDRSGCGWVQATVGALAASVVNCGIYVGSVRAGPTFCLALRASQNSCSFPKGRYYAVAALLPLAVRENIACNERIYLSGLLLFTARRCVRACDLDHAARSRNDSESKAVQLHNRRYQVQAKTQARCVTCFIRTVETP